MTYEPHPDYRTDYLWWVCDMPPTQAVKYMEIQIKRETRNRVKAELRLAAAHKVIAELKERDDDV